MELRLSDKVAIVTGAGQGIGKAVALRLAREGADVVVAEINQVTAEQTAQELRALNRRALAQPVDVARPAQIQAMVERAVVAFGRIDILVNVAGIAQTRPFLELAEEDWDRVLDANLKGTVFCMQAVGRQMIRQIPPEVLARGEPLGGERVPLSERGQDVRGTRGQDARDTEGQDVRDTRGQDARDTEGQDVRDTQGQDVRDTQGQDVLLTCSYGRIVNFSSISGRRGRSLQMAYAASKAGIISVTQSAALAFSPYYINVNAVCPGVVPTPMWEQIDRDRGRIAGVGPGAAMKAFLEKVPLRRAGRPEDIAGAVAFLCSPDADYITGQTLNVDGGFEMN